SRAAEVGCDVVRRLVRLDETVDIHVTDGLDSPDERAPPLAADPAAPASLRLDLVALRDRDLTHVVAEPGDPQAMGLVPAGGCPRPCAEAPSDHRILPITDDVLAASAEAGLDEGELPVAVRGLMEVHELHV